MKKTSVLLLAGAVLALAAAAIWLRPAPDTGRITLLGNVDIRQVTLAFDAAERVLEMRVEEGDAVKAGDVLARLDSRTVALRIEQARAQIAVREQAALRLQNGSRPEEVAQAKARVNAAQAERTLAQQQLTRLRGISTQTDGRGVSRQDIESAASRLAVAQAQLDAQREALELTQTGPRSEDIGQADAELRVARAELALLQHQLDQTELRAPTDAVIRSRLLEPGDMASPQRPAYTLALTDPKWIRVYIDETRLGQIRVGTVAAITTDSHPGQTITGRVGFISSVAEFTPKTVQTEALRTSLVYEVRVLVDDPQDRLRLGMPATVVIDVQQDRAAAS